MTKPYPQISYGEQLMKRFLDEILKGEECLDNVRPDWLVWSKKSNPLELDRYYPGLKLAFEFQGEQHYRPEVFGIQGFNKRRQFDKKKKKICKTRGIQLIYVDARRLEWVWLCSRIRRYFKRWLVQKERLYGSRRSMVPLKARRWVLKALNKEAINYRKILKEKYGDLVSVHFKPKRAEVHRLLDARIRTLNRGEEYGKG